LSGCPRSILDRLAPIVSLLIRVVFFEIRGERQETKAKRKTTDDFPIDKVNSL
jgi:hypothetical protein